MAKFRNPFWCALLAALSLAANLTAVEPLTNRPPQWAAPIQKPGLPNLHQVSDTLYRGAQPTREGMRQLSRMGIRTVINLRSFHSDRDELGDLPLRPEHVYFKTWHPEDQEVVRFLRMATNATNTPVFVHCQHGADRTGLMCAIYRVTVQGWTRQAAIQEMTQGGFGYHVVWTNLVEYLEKLDLDAIQRRAGLRLHP